MGSSTNANINIFSYVFKASTNILFKSVGKFSGCLRWSIV